MASALLGRPGTGGVPGAKNPRGPCGGGATAISHEEIVQMMAVNPAKLLGVK